MLIRPFAAILFLTLSWSQPAAATGKHDDSHGKIFEVLKEVDGLPIWMGLYMQGHKVGYFTSNVVDEQASSAPTVTMTTKMIFVVRSGDEVIRQETTAREIFDRRPPFRLRSLTEETMQKGQVERLRIRRVDGPTAYVAEIIQGGESRTEKLELDYRLAHAFSHDLWLRGHPKPGARHRTYSFDSSKLRMVEDELRFKRRVTQMVQGVTTTYSVYDHTFDLKSSDRMTGEMMVLPDGTPLKLSIGGLVEGRLEYEALAKQLDKPQDLFVNNLVAVDGRIGDPRYVSQLVLEVDQALGAQLADGPGQRVLPLPEGRGFRVELNSKHRRDVRVKASERQEALEATLMIPARDSRVIALAKEAVGDAQGPEEQVKRLVRFVSDYVEDHSSIEPLTVMDVIAGKKGDCTEHSMLFAALARAIGIPTREVSGLVYGQNIDGAQAAFGGHAWNEVAVGGYWWPIDATWNETVINATHIRFSSANELATMAQLPKAKLRVIKVVPAAPKQPLPTQDIWDAIFKELE